MNEQRLEQLRSIKAELKYRTIEIENWPQGLVVDFCYDYPNGKKRVRPLIGMGDCSGLKTQLQQRIDELERERIAVEKYLESLPDQELRSMLTLRYVYGLTHQQIGKEIGYERSVITRKIQHYFESCTQNTL